MQPVQPRTSARQRWCLEHGQAELAYVLVTVFLSVVVVRPDLLAAIAYQAADLFQLFLMQLDLVF